MSGWGTVLLISLLDLVLYGEVIYDRVSGVSNVLPETVKTGTASLRCFGHCQY